MELSRISRRLRLWIDPEESFHTHCYHVNGLFIGGIIESTHISDQANEEVHYGAKYKHTTCMYIEYLLVGLPSNFIGRVQSRI